MAILAMPEHGRDARGSADLKVGATSPGGLTAGFAHRRSLRLKDPFIRKLCVFASRRENVSWGHTARSGVGVQDLADAVAVLPHLVLEAGKHAHHDAILRLDAEQNFRKGRIHLFRRPRSAPGGEDFE